MGDMKSRSDNFFHFTKKRETLFKILKGGFFWPKYSLEDISWNTTEPGFVAFPMVCFCDIPLSRISDHTEFYGDYGLGLSHKWGTKKGLNPLIYVNKESEITKRLRRTMLAALDKYKDNDKKSKTEKDYECVWDVLSISAFIKPTEGETKRGKETVKTEFYLECEWRYVPQFTSNSMKPLLSEQEFKDPIVLQEANDFALQKGRLFFEAGDIKYIFVKTNEDIIETYDFIHREIQTKPTNDLKLMCSRIVSLDELTKDV